MMPGMIMLWYGPIADIPSGWHHCDGTSGTPDLRDKFVVCAKEDMNDVAKSDILGVLLQSWFSTTHLHAFTGDGHAHDLADGVAIEGGLPDGDYLHQTTVSPATGDTDLASHVPSFFALAYIMKLPIP
ncbi:hypothetical protein ES703_43266 [subsurface metagenome]